MVKLVNTATLKVADFGLEGPTPSIPITLLSILRLRSIRVGNCLIWTGAITKSTGYGKIKYNKKCWDVHRLLGTYLFGELTTKDMICHKNECTNRACIEPSHLYKGDRSTNMMDAFMKGTFNNFGRA